MTKPSGHKNGAVASYAALEVEKSVTGAAEVRLAVDAEFLLHQTSNHDDPEFINKMKVFTTPTSLDRKLEPSPKMKDSVAAVEKIVGYNFKNKRLLEEALTHSSFPWSASYERLENLGDSALNHAVTNYFFCMADRQKLNQDQITKLRSINTGNLKFACVAVRLGLYPYLRRYNTPALDEKVREFTEAVINGEEEMGLLYGKSDEAKVLADIVESVAAAIYIELNFDLDKLWMKFKPLLEPIYTLEDLQGSSDRQSAKEAVKKKLLFKGTAAGNDSPFHIEEAKHELHVLCVNQRLPGPPEYKEENAFGPPHERKYVYSVRVVMSDGTVQSVTGDEKSRIKYAMNSAAYKMILALQEYYNMTPESLIE